MCTNRRVRLANRAWQLPPGPKRRALLRKIGFNLAPEDFTAAEQADMAARAAKIQERSNEQGD